MVYIKLQAHWLPITCTSDYGDFQQIGHSNNRVLSSTWNAFMSIIAILTKYFEVRINLHSQERRIVYIMNLCKIELQTHVKYNQWRCSFSKYLITINIFYYYYNCIFFYKLKFLFLKKYDFKWRPEIIVYIMNLFLSCNLRFRQRDENTTERSQAKPGCNLPS